ncbi:MAG: 50S ribosomal protein L11 methyltransferase [Deltaproteobacteria bacterium]|jgi:ribosomal protein L11 methyltransferase|nr:50S ribosomal protein L11 methyltransferase [Deltaproteobacteria bacterium]MBW2493039.1 50S ribosomal protein L11 methyltransferase [Deltaproteobacteria bacterium]
MFYRIEDIVIRSPYSVRRPNAGEDCLVLKTSRSFPPAHPSTKAALTILYRLEIKKGARILDIGCGSGILGLAAALRNGGTAVGCDIWMGSIRASVKNTALNRMQDRFHCFCGSVDAVSGTFNLVLANLQAATHSQMFDHYRRLLPQKEDLLVVSGFYDVHAPHMEKELVQRGFVVMEQVKVHQSAAALTEVCSDTWVGFGLRRV